jgi:hypothetical protein
MKAGLLGSSGISLTWVAPNGKNGMNPGEKEYNGCILIPGDGCSSRTSLDIALGAGDDFHGLGHLELLPSY